MTQRRHSHAATDAASPLLVGDAEGGAGANPQFPTLEGDVRTTMQLVLNRLEKQDALGRHLSTLDIRLGTRLDARLGVVMRSMKGMRLSHRYLLTLTAPHPMAYAAVNTGPPRVSVGYKGRYATRGVTCFRVQSSA